MAIMLYMGINSFFILNFVAPADSLDTQQFMIR